MRPYILRTQGQRPWQCSARPLSSFFADVGVDVVVNNAGIMPLIPIAKGDIEVFDKVIATNLSRRFPGAGTGSGVEGLVHVLANEILNKRSRLALCLGLLFFAIQLLQATNLAKKVALVTDASKRHRSFESA